jgi:hypothetical protein
VARVATMMSDKRRLRQALARAGACGRTVLTGAGFGVTATESVVVKLCDGRTAPERVIAASREAPSSPDGPAWRSVAAVQVAPRVSRTHRV